MHLGPITCAFPVQASWLFECHGRPSMREPGAVGRSNTGLTEMHGVVQAIYVVCDFCTRSYHRFRYVGYATCSSATTRKPTSLYKHFFAQPPVAGVPWLSVHCAWHQPVRTEGKKLTRESGDRVRNGEASDNLSTWASRDTLRREDRPRQRQRM